MLAFMGKGVVREVHVPDGETTDKIHVLLELIWHYGQNDMQEVRDKCSVSMGDVVEIGNRYFTARSVGWLELTKGEFELMRDRTTRSGAAYHGIEPPRSIPDEGGAWKWVRQQCSNMGILRDWKPRKRKAK